MKYNYLEIRSYKTSKVIKRMDMTGKSVREIDKIDSGINRQLNHDEYYTFMSESDSELECF